MWTDVQVSAGGGEGAGHPGHRRAEPADKRCHLHPGNLTDTSILGTVIVQVPVFGIQVPRYRYGTGTASVQIIPI
jgi:hypothetical protein